MNVSSSVSSIASSIFSKLDSKNQGYIDKADLQKAFDTIDSSSSDSSTSNVDDLFSKMDSDSDGKITESELSTSINNLVSQLNSQMTSSRMGMPPPDGKGPPPGKDDGFTKDEMTNIAATTDDSKLAGLMTTISSNFEAADTNQDGKVTSQEAMAYQRTADSSSAIQTGQTGSGTTGDSSSSNSSASDQQAASTLMKIAQLIHAYGFGDTSSSTSISASA